MTQRVISRASGWRCRTQCGFNSGVRGNLIGEAAQEKKLRLVAEVAHRAWQ
jgi:hypothetical protein